jgi:hypothetical protein
LEIQDIFKMSDEITKELLDDATCFYIAAHIWGEKNPGQDWIPEDEFVAIAQMVRNAGSHLFFLREVLRGNLKWQVSKDNNEFLINRTDMEGLKAILDLRLDHDENNP